MLVRGIAKQVPLGETMSGLGVYETIQERVQNLRVPESVGRLSLQQLLFVSKLSYDTFNLMPVDTDGNPHSGGDSSSEVIFGIHSPYRQSHLLVMPSLEDQPGVKAVRGYNHQTFYSSASGHDTFDVGIGFSPNSNYDAISLGIAEEMLPGYCWRQEHDPNISVTNETVAVWHSALEFPGHN